MADRKQKLTVREAKLVNLKAKGVKLKDAYPQAGYSKPSSDKIATVNASKVLAKTHVQEALQEAFKKNGITLDAAIAPIGKALTATKVVITGKDEDAFAEVVEDLDLQLKGSDRALKLMGISNNIEGGTTNINFINVQSADKDEFNIR